MTVDQRIPKSFARFAVVAFVAFGASACSSVPEWADPTGWIGGSDDQAAVANDSSAAAPTPDLAAIPDKPAAPSTSDERKEVSESLAADRASAQYSGDALRAGTEASAAPPPDAPPATTESASVSGPAQSAQAANSEQPAAVDNSAASTTAAPPAPAASTQTADIAPAAPVAPAPAAEVASVAPASESSATSATVADPLGFQPSRAPALDPSVAKFVPKSVLDRYQQLSTDGTAPTGGTPQQKSDSKQTSAIDPSTEEHASGRSAGANSRPRNGMMTPAAYTPGRQSGPQAIVFFSGKSAVLNAKAKEQIRTAAEAFQSMGGASFVRVVGHSSSRTANMPMEQHLEVVFRHSQDFATAVAHELIRDGIPADKVLIEAVGDSQPVYFESMPQGEAGNRRAEIFM